MRPPQGSVRLVGWLVGVFLAAVLLGLVTWVTTFAPAAACGYDRSPASATSNVPLATTRCSPRSTAASRSLVTKPRDTLVAQRGAALSVRSHWPLWSWAPTALAPSPSLESRCHTNTLCVVVISCLSQGRRGPPQTAVAMRIAAEGGAGAVDRVVIGKMADITADGALGPGERTLLDQLPKLATEEEQWAQNERVLLQEMKSGNPIRDATVDELGNPTNNTGYLFWERATLLREGWTYDPATNLWSPGG